MGLELHHGRSGKDPARSVLRRPLAALATVVVAGAVTAVGTATPASAIPAWRSLSVGFNHACAVSGTGELYCWGDNSNGKLGTGDTTSRKKPTRIGSSISWTSVAAGKEHTCAIGGSNDTVYCWGRYAPSASSRTPVSSGMPYWDRLSAGWEHTCGIKYDSTMYCWGSNANGQLGLMFRKRNHHLGISCPLSDGTFDRCRVEEMDPPWLNPEALPVIAWDESMGGLGHSIWDYVVVDKWREVDAGSGTTCAVSPNKDRYCWGVDHKEALGLGDRKPWRQPKNAWIDQFDNPTATSEDNHITWWSVAVGENYSGCGIDTNYAMHCWGNNGSGQLSTGDRATRHLPTLVDENVREVTAGTSHACSIASNGRAYCWGANSNGQLGMGGTGDKLTPQRVRTSSGGDIRWGTVKAGAGFTCGVSADSLLYCWGLNDKGQLGDNTTTNRTTPREVSFS